MIGERTKTLLVSGALLAAFGAVFLSLSLATRMWMHFEQSVSVPALSGTAAATPLAAWFGLVTYGLEVEVSDDDVRSKKGRTADFENPLRPGAGESGIWGASISCLLCGIVALLAVIPAFWFIIRLTQRGGADERAYKLSALSSLVSCVMAAAAVGTYGIFRPTADPFFSLCRLSWAYVGALCGCGFFAISAGLIEHARRLEFSPADIILRNNPVPVPLSEPCEEYGPAHDIPSVIVSDDPYPSGTYVAQPAHSRRTVPSAETADDRPKRDETASFIA